MARTLMPKSNLQFKERSARRAIRAACKEGLIVGAVEIAPDGKRWSRLAGQNGGLAKVDSGFDYAANLSLFACVA